MNEIMRPEVVTFGETMALMTPSNSAGLEHSGQLMKSFGGAEGNMAIGLSRLGHKAGWFGFLGNDPFGKHIYKTIRGEGVDVSRARMIKDAPTGLMFRDTQYGKISIYYYRSVSAARLIRPEDLDEAYIASARLLHVTGITPALSQSCKETVLAAVAMARKHGVKVCVDPNLRLKLWSIEEARKVIWELAEQADYFMPGLDELSHLFPGEDDGALMERLRQLPGVSVLKGNGCTYLLEQGNTETIDWVKADHIVDPIGAGDGFCAGFIAGLLKGMSHIEAVNLGNLVGSLVVQGYGDWEALPDWTEVSKILDKQQHIER